MKEDKDMEREETIEETKEGETKMYFRQLSDREKEILHMIKPTTFQDMVDEVRRYYDDMRYARKHLINFNRNS